MVSCWKNVLHCPSRGQTPILAVPKTLPCVNLSVNDVTLSFRINDQILITTFFPFPVLAMAFNVQ